MQQERETGKRELPNVQKTINKMAIVSPELSLIMLNINGLNSPIKRHRVDEWIEKQHNYMLPTRGSLQL